MRSPLLALLLVLATPLIALAQPSGGRVLDASTGAPIAGATITVDGTDMSLTSDGDGGFSLEGVPADATLVIVADGYEASLVTNDRGWTGDVVLLPEGTTGEIIEITGEAPPEAPGATQLDRDEVSRLPGTGNDLIASLDALPGVTGGFTAASFNGVVIRGAAPEDSKILVDGFEVPLLYHIGLRSIIPTESIASLEYLPGGFDVAYGRASSGIVSVTTRGGERDPGGQAELSVIDGGVLGRGPVGDEGTFLLAVRRSTIDFILPSIIPDDANLSLTTVPRYYDLQARLDVPAGPRWNLSVSAIGSDDVVEAFADDEADPDEHFFAQTRFLRVTGAARWSRDRWSANLATSLLGQGLEFEAGRDLYFETTRLASTSRGELTWSADDVDGLRDVVWRAGGEVDLQRWRLRLALPDAPEEGQPDVDTMDDGPPDPMNTFDGVVNVPDLAAWTAFTAGFGPIFRLTTGLRVDGFLRIGEAAIQPRGELAAKLTEQTTARLVVGAYRRPPENQAEYLEPQLSPERATQSIVGVEHAVGGGLKLQASLYYTDRSSLITRDAMGEYTNDGRGTTYGGELLATLRRGPWFGFLSYAASRSSRVDAPGAEERLFDYDQPHDLNVALSWKRGRWQLGGRFSFGSGLPYTPVLGAIFDSDADRYIPVYGAVNSARVQSRHQLDVRIDRAFWAGPIAMTAFLDVQNVYMNTPIVGYGYNFDYSERYAFESIPILPSIGLRGEL
jgi:hypothetical protein